MIIEIDVYFLVFGKKVELIIVDLITIGGMEVFYWVLLLN